MPSSCGIPGRVRPSNTTLNKLSADMSSLHIAYEDFFNVSRKPFCSGVQPAGRNARVSGGKISHQTSRNHFPKEAKRKQIQTVDHG
jgi:hypothetical protein